MPILGAIVAGATTKTVDIHSRRPGDTVKTKRPIHPTVAEGLRTLGRVGVRAGTAFLDSLLQDAGDVLEVAAEEVKARRAKVKRYPRERE